MSFDSGQGLLGNKKIIAEFRENQDAASTKRRTLNAWKKLKIMGNKTKQKNEQK